MPDTTRWLHQNGGATEAHALLALSHRSTCPNSFQKFASAFPRPRVALSLHFCPRRDRHPRLPGPASRPPPPSGGRWAASRRRTGLPTRCSAVPPIPPRGPHWQPPRAWGSGAVLRLVGVACPSRTRGGDYVGSPGRVSNPPPPVAPLSSSPGPLHSEGGLALPSPGSPSAPEAPGPRRWGSPGRRLGSSL